MQQRYAMKSWKDFFKNIASLDLEKTLLVCDIDDTILRPKMWIGSTKWFDWQCNLLEQDKKSPYLIAKTFNKLIQALHKIYQDIEMCICEPEIMSENLLSKCDTIFLTARDQQTSDITLDQLNTLVNWKKPNNIKDIIIGEMKFINGIGFTSGQNKGELLFNILKSLDQTYDTIIFVDDKINNIIAVENVMGTQEIISFLYDNPSYTKSFDLMSPNDLKLEYEKYTKTSKAKTN